DFTDWRIHFGGATEPFSTVISFRGFRGMVMGSHRYFLIELGPESNNGAPVPDPDVFIPPIPGLPPLPTFSPSGKIFFTPPGSSFPVGNCPLPNSQIVDFLGYGATANCFEGAGPAPTTGNFTAAF